LRWSSAARRATAVTVTVLDHAARTKVVLRDDGASPHSLQHSLNKAYTAPYLPRAFGRLRQPRRSEFSGERLAAELGQDHHFGRRFADPRR
jgi:uncharacterized protein GlcG (DUF336 family)